MRNDVPGGVTGPCVSDPRRFWRAKGGGWWPWYRSIYVRSLPRRRRLVSNPATGDILLYTAFAAGRRRFSLSKWTGPLAFAFWTSGCSVLARACPKKIAKGARLAGMFRIMLTVAVPRKRSNWRATLYTLVASNTERPTHRTFHALMPPPLHHPGPVPHPIGIAILPG